jgi:hypothetical protein
MPKTLSNIYQWDDNGLRLRVHSFRLLPVK